MPPMTNAATAVRLQCALAGGWEQSRHLVTMASLHLHGVSDLNGVSVWAGTSVLSGSVHIKPPILKIPRLCGKHTNAAVNCQGFLFAQMHMSNLVVAVHCLQVSADRAWQMQLMLLLLMQNQMEGSGCKQQHMLYCIVC